MLDRKKLMTSENEKKAQAMLTSLKKLRDDAANLAGAVCLQDVIDAKRFIEVYEAIDDCVGKLENAITDVYP